MSKDDDDPTTTSDDSDDVKLVKGPNSDKAVAEAAAADAGAPWKDSFINASAVQFVTYSWATEFIRKAFTREVDSEEIWNLRKSESCDYTFQQFSLAWDRELQLPLEQRSLSRAVRRSLCGSFIDAGAGKVVWLAVTLLTNAYVLPELLTVLAKVQKSQEDGTDSGYQMVEVGSMEVPVVALIYAFSFGLLEIFRSLFINLYWTHASMAGSRIQSAMSHLIYDRVTRLRTVTNTGKVMNLMMNDGQRFLESGIYGLFIFSGPISLVAFILAGLYVLGPAVLAGFIILLVAVPIQTLLGKRTGKIRRAAVAITDERVSIVNEILSAIKLIKLYAWEPSFARKVETVRAREIWQIRKAAFINACNVVFGQCIPVVVTFITFAFHTLVLGNTLTSAQAFGTIALFNASRFPLAVLPIAVKAVSEALVSLSRIESFLLSQPTMDSGTSPSMHPSEEGPGPNNARVNINNAVFVWEEEQEEDEDGISDKKNKRKQGVDMDIMKMEGVPTTDAGAADAAEFGSLVVPELTIKDGQLVAVLGAVGSGKSALLSGALCGEMVRIKGSTDVYGSVAYCPQTPWCFNGTIVENITFGRPLQEARLEGVLKACALNADLATFPAGKYTEIGERGINLSGGQKARISLARAMYTNCDVYILDDVFSAVDVHTATHLWEECVKGMLKNKTVLLATHSTRFISQCDGVVVVKAGTVDSMLSLTGTKGKNWKEVVAQAGVELDDDDDVIDDVIDDITSGAVGQVEDSNSNYQRTSNSTAASVSPHKTTGIRVASSAGAGGRNALSSASVASTSRPGSSGSALNKASDFGGDGKLVVQEDRAVGAVKWATVFHFVRQAGGKLVSFSVVFAFFLTELSKTATDYWVSIWTDDSLSLEPFETTVFNSTSNTSSVFETEPSMPVNGISPDAFYLLCLGLLSVGFTIISIARGYAFAAYMLRASKALHDSAFFVLMNAQMSFFDVTPTGRLLNRFSSDIDRVDVALVNSLENCATLMIRVMISVVLIAVIMPWFIIVIVLVGVIYLRLLEYMRRVIRQIKRIESMSKSPVLNHVASTVNGLSTYRSYNQLNKARLTYADAQDKATRAALAFIFCNRWIAFRLDFITTIIALSAALLVAIFSSTLPAGIAGLVLTSALQCGGIFQYASRMLAETESHFTSVERLRSFEEFTPREDSIAKGAVETTPLSAEWPATGLVEFRKVTCRYQSHLPLVLTGLSFRAESGQRVGLVGRTGCGKSTSLLALFRILEVNTGSIAIDAVDISTVPLQRIRSRLSIIPQEPTLFTGSVRFNCDPFSEHSDGDIWSALKKVQLSDLVAELPGQLTYELTENGANFSAGQRQLVSFARSLLRKSPVMVLDEATSSIDEDTDAQIQQTIRDAFKGTTLIIIAHRLDTVMQCDTIVVMSKGAEEEVGSPKTLANKEGSLLYELVHEAGHDEASRLLAMIE